ncbi:hypothetical protein ACFL0Y_04825 [Patescibacteria group bacterium]
MNPEAPNYDPNFVQQLIDEEGLSPNEAVLIAATSMDGAWENPDGSIDSHQTYCDVLDYDEHIREREDGSIVGGFVSRRARRIL